jgi:hypothetical protein
MPHTETLGGLPRSENSIIERRALFEGGSPSGPVPTPGTPRRLRPSDPALPPTGAGTRMRLFRFELRRARRRGPRPRGVRRPALRVPVPRQGRVTPPCMPPTGAMPRAASCARAAGAVDIRDYLGCSIRSKAGLPLALSRPPSDALTVPLAGPPGIGTSDQTWGAHLQLGPKASARTCNSVQIIGRVPPIDAADAAALT